MSAHMDLANAQLAAVDCSLTCKRILKLLDDRNAHAQIPDELSLLKKDYDRLVSATQSLGIAP